MRKITTFCQIILLFLIQNAAAQNLCSTIPQKDLPIEKAFQILTSPPPVPVERYNNDVIDSIMCFAKVNLKYNTCLLIYTAISENENLAFLGVIHKVVLINQTLHCNIDFTKSGYSQTNLDFSICKYNNDDVLIEEMGYPEKKYSSSLLYIIGDLSAYSANFNSQNSRQSLTNGSKGRVQLKVFSPSPIQ